MEDNVDAILFVDVTKRIHYDTLGSVTLQEMTDTLALGEGDVEGASVSAKIITKLSVAELKFWLKYHGTSAI